MMTMRRPLLLAAILLGLLLVVPACEEGEPPAEKPAEEAAPGATAPADDGEDETMPEDQPPARDDDGTKLATFGAGCFWCVEAIFAEVEGVRSVVPGYTGGHVDDPTYKQVCSGTTGHAEVAQIRYDPEVVSYEKLLEVFFKTHDPTTLDRQGADVGTQYRSAIFVHDEDQREAAERVKAALDEAGAFERPIVTEITPIGRFYEAEDYHHDYYANNPDQGYCRVVIAPKLEKFRKAFADILEKPADQPADDPAR